MGVQLYDYERVAQFTAMWSLALAALAALVVSVDCQCLEIYEPLNKTMRRLEFNGSRSWLEVDSMCKEQFPGGFEMLSRDFLGLSEADRVLCRGQAVPLGLEKAGLGPIVWRESEFIDQKEEVNSTYLARKRGRMTLNKTAHAQVGSLDLTTNHWRLVDNDTSFTCAICQRAWFDWLRQLSVKPPSRPNPLKYAYEFRLVKTGNDNVTVDEVLRLLGNDLSGMVSVWYPDGIQTEFEKLATESNADNGTSSFRVRSSFALNSAQVSRMLNGSYAVESWRDADECQDMVLDGILWTKEYRGWVREVTLPEFHVATRLCWVQKRGDNGDYDAVWDKEFLSWINHDELCKAEGAKNLVRQLENFTARQASNMNLESLVKMTTEIPKLEWPEGAFYESIGNVSAAIQGALSALLISRETTRNASKTCSGYACVFVTAHDQVVDDPDTVEFTRRDLPPTFFSSKVIGHATRSFEITLQISKRLTSAPRVALHTVQDGDEKRNVARIFYPYGKFYSFYFSQAVLVHLTSATPLEAWQAEGKWPVTFHVNNSGTDQDVFRYISVWSRGASEKSTLPCPLVRSRGSMDTFVCNKFERGTRNFTSGAFLVFSGIQSNYFDFARYTVNVFRGYVDAHIDESALQVVLNLTDRVVEKSSYNTSAIHGALERILSKVVLNDPFITVTKSHVKVLVSNLTVGDPVVGFSLDGLAGVGPVHTIAGGERNNVSSESAMDLVLGADVEQHCKQLAILSVVNFTDKFYADGSLGAYIKRKMMGVHLVAASRSTPDESSSKDVYLDIQLHRDRVVYHGDVFSNTSDRRFLVASWSYKNSDWSVSTCGKLRSTRASKLVFRCQQLTTAWGHDFRGRFLIFESFRFADSLSDTWWGVLIAAGVLSGVSLVSIFGTAATQASWRQDLGHKILLQMTLALALNLALGFASPFVSFDTAGVPCYLVGAFRHFSYLAMFAWMLVMSGLQLRRLLSVLGARTTPHLLPKVSLGAWGLPTVAVSAFLVFNKDMYRSDVADRGFCYPEGGDFVWSIQVPAGTILSLNFIIFMVILARLFGFCGWGGMEGMRRHLDERTLRLRRLRAVFITFCLFGIAWIFHLLAEQGVFQSKYLYEYFFLMTASIHVFSLACIFVFCDRQVRDGWAKLLAPFTTRYFT